MALTVRKEKKSRVAEDGAAPPGRNRALYYSLLLHAILVVVFVVGIEWKSSTVIAPASAPQVMNATTVDAKQLDQEIKKLQSVDEEKKQREAERQAEAARKVKEEEQKLEKLKQEQAEAKRQKEADNRRLEEERKKLETEKEQAAVAKAKAEAEKKKVEEETKRATEAARKREAEERAKAEAKAKEDAKAEAERKKRTEEGAKKKAAEEKRKAEEAKAQAALQEAMAAEEAEQAAAAQAQADATALQRYIARLTNAVAAGFVYPPGLPPGLKCTLFVRVIPGGEVVEARVVKSSGNAVFDRQAETAVRKASPLPMPEEPRLASQLREFNFSFDPGS